MQDYLRIVDSGVDKIKNIIIVNYDHKVYKILVQFIQTFVEDEPGLVSVYKIKMLKTGAKQMNSDLVFKMIDDLVAADKDKNQMVDEKEAMGQLMQWSKWGLTQVLAAWD